MSFFEELRNAGFIIDENNFSESQLTLLRKIKRKSMSLENIDDDSEKNKVISEIEDLKSEFKSTLEKDENNPPNPKDDTEKSSNTGLLVGLGLLGLGILFGLAGLQVNKS